MSCRNCLVLPIATLCPWDLLSHHLIEFYIWYACAETRSIGRRTSIIQRVIRVDIEMSILLSNLVDWSLLKFTFLIQKLRLFTFSVLGLSVENFWDILDFEAALASIQIYRSQNHVFFVIRHLCSELRIDFFVTNILNFFSKLGLYFDFVTILLILVFVIIYARLEALVF